MKGKKIILIISLILVMFFLGVDGAQEVGTYKQNEAIELTQICSNSTSICDICNITSVLYPNSSVAVANVAMTKRDSDFNYTLLRNQTQSIGKYIVNGFCKSGVEYQVWSYSFLVSKSGNILTTGDSILYLIFFLGALFAFILCVILSIKLPFDDKRDDEGYIIQPSNLKFVKLVFVVMSYLLFMMLFGILRSVSDNYLFLSGATNFFTYVYWILFSLMFPLMIFIAILFFATWVKNQNIAKSLERGMKIT